MYSFLFDRKSLILLVAGLATVGALLFFAGLLTGVFWGIPGGAQAAPGPTQAASPAAFLPSLPCRPASRSEELGDEPSGEPVPLEAPETDGPRGPRGAEPRQVAQLENGLADEPFEESSRNPAPELDPAQAEASNLARASAPQPTAKPAAPMAPMAPAVPIAPSATKSAETQLASAAAPLPDSHPSDQQEPQAETVSAAKPAVLRTALYSLQIGAFRKPENSSRIVQDLQSRGYDAYVVQEKGGRVILTVRVGRFAEREEALRAADEFRRREGKAVIVRTLSSYPATSW